VQIPLKFITNATRRPRRRVVNDLASLGLEVAIEDVVTPATLAPEFLAREKLAPLLIVRPDLREDFLGLKS
jgi:ribonucleotide monophosphatase NagD (HAD superfamily)